MKKKLIIYNLIIVVAICMCIFSGCGRKKSDNGKINIVTTLFPQYDFTREIVGDKANVTLLLKPGIEAHSFDPSPSDIVDINQCDLFIYTGEYMEAWAENIIDDMKKDVNVLDVSKGIDIVKVEEEHNEDEHKEDAHEENEDNHNEVANDENLSEKSEESHEGHSHEFDPHIWTSPVNAKKMVENILLQIIKIDPENEEYYRNNAKKYIEELEELDSEIRETVNNADIKTLYFAGKFAMYYFAHEYGLDYISAYDSCQSETEPSAKLVAKIVDEVKLNKAPVVYYEELSNHKAADTIAKETNAQPLLLHSCHNISKEEFSNGVTYLSLMKQNIVNLKKGLYLNDK